MNRRFTREHYSDIAAVFAKVNAAYPKPSAKVEALIRGLEAMFAFDDPHFQPERFRAAIAGRDYDFGGRAGLHALRELDRINTGGKLKPDEDQRTRGLSEYLLYQTGHRKGDNGSEG